MMMTLSASSNALATVGVSAILFAFHRHLFCALWAIKQDPDTKLLAVHRLT
jgi:hypothetical protein